MPIVTETEPGSFNQYFGEFLTAYPTPLDRYTGALKLAQGNTEGSAPQLAAWGYRSHNFLLAHFRDNEAELRAAADYIYTLAAAVHDAFYQPAMVFRGGTPEDIDKDTYLPPTLTIDYGVIFHKDITHSYKAEMDSARRIVRQGIRPRYLGYGVGIQVCKAQVITADLGMESCTTELAKGNPPLLACFGTVSLEQVVNEGEATKAKEERIAVVGKNKCQGIIDGLIKRCWDSDAETIKNLENMARGYNFRP